MDKSMHGKMVGAALVLGLSVGISIEQALAVGDLQVVSDNKHPEGRRNVEQALAMDAAAGNCGPGCRQTSIAGIPGSMPNVNKVEHTASSQFTAPGDVAGMKSGAASETNHYKLSDVIVSSATDDAANTETSIHGGKANARPRSNARKRGPN